MSTRSSIRALALMAQHAEHTAALLGRVKVALYRGLKVGYTTEAHSIYWLGLFDSLTTLVKKGDELAVFSKLEKLGTDVTILESTVRDAELQYYFREASLPTLGAGLGRWREKKHS